jgi:hypothetical protein
MSARTSVISALSGVVCGLAVTAAIVTTSPASARSAYESTYGYDRTWNAALRLVRVDLGLKITEKDQDSGYLMFEYRSPESRNGTPGSMEFVRSKEPNSPVRVVVQLTQMPRYHEQVLVDALAKKMHLEYGDPPAIHPAPPKAEGDAGED